jgi:hypothetical protein
MVVEPLHVVTPPDPDPTVGLWSSGQCCLDGMMASPWYSQYILPTVVDLETSSLQYTRTLTTPHQTNYQPKTINMPVHPKEEEATGSKLHQPTAHMLSSEMEA